MRNRVPQLVVVLAGLLSLSPALLAQEAAPASIELPASVVGGATVTGTVTLTAPASALGQLVRITSSSPAAVVSSTALKVTGVTVAFMQTKATFQLATRGVGAPTIVTITAVAGGVTKATRFIVKPPSVTALAIPSPSAGGTPLSATVQLDARAPAASAELSSSGGLVVSLTASEGSVPATVTVPAGQTSATFQFVADAVAAPATIKIAAAGPGQTAPVATTVTIVPPVVRTLSFTASPVTGGTPSTGKVSLTGKAPAGGKTIALTGSVAAVSFATTSSGTGGAKAALSSVATTATFPDSVFVPSGQDSVSFAITTLPVVTNTTVLFVADEGTATLTVLAPVPTSLTVQPQRILGGSGATGTLTLSGPAPSQAFTVPLVNGNPAAVTVPASVTIAAGQRTATFAIETVPVDAAATVAITAGQSGPRATVSVLARSVASVTLNTARVAGGSTVNGTVSINGPAPAEGLRINLEQRSCQGAAPLSSTGGFTDGTSNTIGFSSLNAVVPAGQTVGAFQIGTTRVGDETCIRVVAYQGARAEDDADAKSTTLTVLPPLPQSLSMAFPEAGNATSGIGRVAGVVEFAGSWSVIPTDVAVVCSPAAFQSTSVPLRVVNDGIVGANSRGTFETFTIPVGADTVVTCSVSRGGVTKTATVTVLGPRLQDLELAATRVVGGTSVTGTIAIDRRAPANGVTVALDGNNDAVASVSRVTVPSSQTLGAFQISTAAVTTETLVTISASLNGTTKTATLTVTPP